MYPTNIVAGAAGSTPQQPAKLRDKTAAVSPSAKAIKGSPAASPDPHEDSKKKKKKHSLFGGKARSKSESPERLPKTSKKASSSKDVVTGHPLETASSMKSLDRESANITEESGSTAANILDIIRQYDKKDELAKSQSRMGHEKMTAGASGEPTTQLGKSTKGKADSSKKETTSGKGKGQRDREKEKPTKDDKKKESRESSSGRGLLSKLFKRGKTHEEGETATSKQQKKQAKKDKEKEKEGKRTASKDSKADEKRLEQRQLTIKGRIERLKESGVYTDGSEDADSAPVVLVSVTKHEEESDLITDSQSAELADKGRDGSPDIKEEQMRRVEADEGRDEIVPVAEKEEDHRVHFKETGSEEELEGGSREVEESETQDTVDRVKRLQSIFQSHAAVSDKRTRRPITRWKVPLGIGRHHFLSNAGSREETWSGKVVQH